MKIELDLKKIGQIAKQKSAENISFQTYLKGQDAQKTDEIVHRLYKEFTIKISCVDCGNCCQNLRPIASYKELSKFVEDKDIEVFMYLESISCKFHKDKKCTDYSNRPEECRSYPDLDEDQFITKTYGALRNYEICPIVFNVFQALKVELDWDYQVKMDG